MDEWEDDMWDYSRGGDNQNFDEDGDDRGGGDEGGDEDGDERSFEDGDDQGGDTEGGGNEGEDLEFDQDFRQQSGYEKKSGTGGPGGMSEGRIKSQRTPQEAASEQVLGILSSSYSHLTEARKQKVVATIENTKNFFNMNIEVLVLAALWSAENKKMERGEFQKWISSQESAKDVNPMDLLRYIRVVELKN